MLPFTPTPPTTRSHQPPSSPWLPRWLQIAGWLVLSLPIMVTWLLLSLRRLPFTFSTFFQIQVEIPWLWLIDGLAILTSVTLFKAGHDLNRVNRHAHALSIALSERTAELHAIKEQAQREILERHQPKPSSAVPNASGKLPLMLFPIPSSLPIQMEKLFAVTTRQRSGSNNLIQPSLGRQWMPIFPVSSRRFALQVRPTFPSQCLLNMAGSK